MAYEFEETMCEDCEKPFDKCQCFCSCGNKLNTDEEKDTLTCGECK